MLTESNDSCQQHLADVTWIYSVASRNLISVASTELVYIPIAIFDIFAWYGKPEGVFVQQSRIISLRVWAC